MAHYIDKDALVAEIKRRIKSTNNDVEIGAIESLTVSKTLNSLISFIDTLEMKEAKLEQEPASENLEQAAKDDSDDELYAIHFEKWNITGECPSELEAKIDAKFGITGRDSNGKPSNGYCDWKKDVFTNGASIYSFVKLGMDYQKEQMTKDALEVEVYGANLILQDGMPRMLNDHDKVKVIIITE